MIKGDLLGIKKRNAIAIEADGSYTETLCPSNSHFAEVNNDLEKSYETEIMYQERETSNSTRPLTDISANVGGRKTHIMADTKLKLERQPFTHWNTLTSRIKRL